LKQCAGAFTNLDLNAAAKLELPVLKLLGTAEG
jgi:hypothetical protein